MPYLLYKSNGQLLTTVDDSSVDISTSLNLVGKNYAGYGLSMDQNFVYLLENFSNTRQPAKPIIGQTWFDTNVGQSKLKIYDGASFKGLATIRIQNAVPFSSVTGDLWWDTRNGLLNAFDGLTYQIIGPSISIKANWLPSDEYDLNAPANSLPIVVLKGSIGNKVVAVISEHLPDFVPDNTANPDLDSDRFEIVKRGITLAGSDRYTGSSKGAGYYFWGTAAESLVAVTATSIAITTSSVVSTATLYVPLTNTSTGNSYLATDSGISYKFDSGTQSWYLNTVASSARYADLAERYESDKPYTIGTLLVIGGEKEVTTTLVPADTRVIGVVSKNPAYMMNSDAGTDETHPFIALKGRVFCRVYGKINKGDLLVTSEHPGYATVFFKGDSPNAVFGKALESNTDSFGFIEVLVI